MADPSLPLPRIGVIGAGTCTSELAHAAYQVGQWIASYPATLVCGGLGGVMENAAKGAFEQGGLTVGILPTSDPGDANPYITIPIPTGMGHARNVLVVLSSQLIIAIGGQAGTLSEIAIALKLGTPIIGYRTWEIVPELKMASTIEELSTLFQQAVKSL